MRLYSNRTLLGPISAYLYLGATCQYFQETGHCVASSVFFFGWCCQCAYDVNEYCILNWISCDGLPGARICAMRYRDPFHPPSLICTSMMCAFNLLTLQVPFREEEERLFVNNKSERKLIDRASQTGIANETTTNGPRSTQYDKKRRKPCVVFSQTRAFYSVFTLRLAVSSCLLPRGEYQNEA